MQTKYAIITFNKNHYLITEKKHCELRSKNNTDFFLPYEDDDRNGIRVNTIAEIMDLSRYYNNYPDKRPQRTDQFKNMEGLGMEVIVKTSHQEAIKGMIRGLEGYINSPRYQKNEQPLKLLKLMESKI